MPESPKARIRKKPELQATLEMLLTPQFLEVCEAAMLEYQYLMGGAANQETAAALYHNLAGARRYLDVLITMGVDQPTPRHQIRQNLES